MYKTLATFAAFIGFNLLVSAHAQTPTPPPPSWQAVVPTQLIFSGDDSITWPEPLKANQALLNASNLRETLDLYGDFPNPSNLGDLIQQIRNANDNSDDEVPGLTGVGGVHGNAFLDAAGEALKNNGTFDNTKQVIVSVSGQIMDYAFDRDPTNPMQGNGSLEVITYITSTRISLGNGPNMVKTEAYRWKIGVENNGFKVIEKGNNPDDPFSGTMPFTPEMLARIDLLGFQFKLWAEGPDIKIDSVERKAGNSPNWVLLQKNNPQYARLYAEIDDNCIDMMFVDSPPAILTDGMAPPFYCLGRCASPLIINTGE